MRTVSSLRPGLFVLRTVFLRDDGALAQVRAVTAARDCATSTVSSGVSTCGASQPILLYAVDKCNLTVFSMHSTTDVLLQLLRSSSAATSTTHYKSLLRIDFKHQTGQDEPARTLAKASNYRQSRLDRLLGSQHERIYFALPCVRFCRQRLPTNLGRVE